MRYTTCKACGRLVPADRKVRAHSYKNVATIAAYMKPWPHFADATGLDQTVCNGSTSAEAQEAAA